MKSSLILCKRVFDEASFYSSKGDAVSAGIAISMFQDSVEMLIWTLIKKHDISVKENSAFTTNLDLLAKEGIRIPFQARLLELNKARVGFKHYGNLPDASEASKFMTYVQETLTVIFEDQFHEVFDTISSLDLIAYPEIKDKLTSAKQNMTNEQWSDALRDLGIARSMLFDRLGKFAPKVPSSLREGDRILDQISGIRGAKPFRIIADYLDAARAATLASLFALSLEDQIFLSRVLPTAYQTGDGKWHTNLGVSLNLDAHAARGLECLVRLSMQLQRTA